MTLTLARLFPWAPGWERLTARTSGQVTGIVVHRIEVSQEDPSFADTAADIARFFREHPVGAKATGGGMPYPLIIAPEGAVTQTVPLGRVTPHAVSHNPTAIGVALVGDFRRAAPSDAQRRACLEVCGALLAELGLAPESVRGHDELTGGSRDPNKECPGRFLPMDELRRELARLAPRVSRQSGFVWE